MRGVVLDLDGVVYVGDQPVPGAAETVDWLVREGQGNHASPALYSEMVAEDRRLRLAGYEVYRFGGYELTRKQDSTAMVQDFFARLADRMR